MIYASKGNIRLQIALQQGKVSIFPEPGEEEDSRLLATIARNEELLAQIDLNTSNGTGAQEQLIRYFSGKGWRIEERHTAPLVADAQDPASRTTR